MGASTDSEIERILTEVDEEVERDTPLGDRSAADLANPSKYVDLDPFRTHVVSMFAPLVWDVVSLIRRSDLDDAGRFVADNLFERVAREAVYASTEIRRHVRWKLLSQRYLSKPVCDAWVALAARRAPEKAFLALDGPKGRLQVTARESTC